jgi:hypothetical protein
LLAGVCSRLSFANVMAVTAVFVALGGTAVALSRNSVGSRQIKRAGVRASDLADNAVSSPKVADGSLLAQDFADGQVPQGPPGIQGPAGSARAYGLVLKDGSLSRSQGVVGVTRTGTGTYCIQLDPSIDASNAVLVANTEFGSSDTVPVTFKAFVEWHRAAGNCPANQNMLEALTWLATLDNVDNDSNVANSNTTGSQLVAHDEAFSFVVP